MEIEENYASLARLIDRTGQAIEFITGIFCVVLFALLVIVVMLGIVFRYVVADPLQWSEEMARFFMLWIGFVALNIATRQDQHLKVDTLFEKLPVLAVVILKFIGNSLVILFLVVLLYKSYYMTMNTMVTASSMPFSMFWVYLSVPLGAGLSLVQLILGIFRNILNHLAQSQNILL